MSADHVIRLARARQFSRSGRGRAVRVASGLSLLDVASAVGVAVSTIYRWERADRVPHGDAAVLWYELCADLERELEVAS